MPGQTKTRLIPALGPAGSAELQRRLTEKTLDTVKSFASERNVAVEVCFEGGSKAKIRRWLGSGMILSCQKLGDLGVRMHEAFLDAFHSGCRRAVLLGTDIPQMTTHHLKQTFNALKENDIVIGPSTDGGYWLMGLNHPVNLFRGINWGTRTVLEQTLALAKEKNLRVKKLDPLTDIDTVEDLNKLLPAWTGNNPYISVIIPVLNEATNIKAAIRSALSEDAEVIVVDGGSTDDTVARAISVGARVEMSPCGRALQQNSAVSVARGHVLLFLHADTALPHGYVAQVFETLVDPKTALGAFRFKTNLDTPLMKIIEFVTNIRSQYFNLPYGDQVLFVRKSAFKSIGGFPEVPIAEDLFFVRRISKLGRIRIAPAHAVTSARRWKTLGLLRTTVINQVILAGLCLGIPLVKLAPLYRVTRRR